MSLIQKLLLTNFFDHPDTKLSLKTLDKLNDFSENTILHSDQYYTYTSRSFLKWYIKKRYLKRCRMGTPA